MVRVWRVAVVLWASVGIASSVLAASLPPIKGRALALSSHPLADKIGQKVLDEGGNAIDAAVAMGYALAVVHPVAGNLGGGGFAVIHLANGENITLDFREKAPLGASRNMYLDKNGNVIPKLSTDGYLAAGVPGTVAGLEAMLKKYGTKKRAVLIQPAIELAQKGFRLTQRQGETMLDAKPRFAKYASSRKYFLKKGLVAYSAGDLLVQKDLAKTLTLIKNGGAQAFYKGPIADLIAKDMAKNGGIITKKDLASYQVVWRKPIEGSYRGYKIISMAPPSSGGTHIIEMLNTMENANIHDLGFGSSKTIHIMAEAMRQAYADRSVFMGDPDFIDVPTARLTDKDYAKKIYQGIPKDKALDSAKINPGLGQIHEGKNTTHYSVADKWGNAVSITYTINDYYGSAAAINGAGFLLNNEMDDFSIKPGVPNLYGLVGGDANAIEPGKRPLSSMSPTIVLKQNKVFMVVGSPGGARIITTVLQVISNVIDHGMNISQAVSAPRFHMQWLPDEIRTEPFGMVKDVQENLEKMGYKIVVKPVMGDVNAIVVDQKSRLMYGAQDPRKEF
ncbi:gamma-glutamyltransferase [Helicobacter felis]|uniref:Glutathione hydrolase proenzyme n=1 Tax=Helicobacter felis (strain ATCC 49179 / CCUG 28539 / NCTC 12436 / CS1) TaxID=936155 RepID=E7AAV1_HELFC|nr:gamma-glutamyltransferase [Helicobacter felis]CBY82772.1 gamma-glutamyltranspeptidase [Helicobacter felis ATCC 49179]